METDALVKMKDIESEVSSSENNLFRKESELISVFEELDI